MFDAARDDVITFVAKREEHPLERKVVGFAAAAGKDDFAAAAAKQLGDLTAGLLERRLCPERGPVAARRITMMIAQEWLHRRGDRGIDRRAGVVIKVNGRHRRLQT